MTRFTLFAMVVKVQVSESECSIAIKHWEDWQKHLSHPDDLKKIDFLNRIIFESPALNTSLHSQYSVTTTRKTNISSISIETMSEIMNEIDNELDDSKTVDDDMKIDSKIKKFIAEPV